MSLFLDLQSLFRDVDVEAACICEIFMSGGFKVWSMVYADCMPSVWPIFLLYASCLLFLASCMWMYVCGCGDSWAVEQDDEHHHDEEEDEEVEEAAGSASSTPRLRGWGAASPRSGGKGFPDGAGESGHGSGRRHHEMHQQVSKLRELRHVTGDRRHARVET